MLKKQPHAPHLARLSSFFICSFMVRADSIRWAQPSALAEPPSTTHMKASASRITAVEPIPPTGDNARLPRPKRAVFKRSRCRRTSPSSGAREHNLKNVDVEIPRDTLTVHHRPVGLGQVLARLRHHLCRGPAALCRKPVGLCAPVPGADAEARRRSHRRPVAGHLHRAEDDLASNPRSTVGTVTEIYDYLRLLFARVGVPYSPATGLPIESQTVSQMADRILALPEGTRLYLLAPIVRGRKGEYRKELAELQKKGFQRVKVDGTFYDIAEAPALDKKFKHDIDVVVDRIVVKPDIGNRLPEFHRDRAGPGRRACWSSNSPTRRTRTTASPKRHHHVVEIRLPGSGLHHSGNRAAAVLVQQSARRLPGLRRAGHEALFRSRGWWCPTRRCPCARAPSRRGRNRPRPITCRRWTRWRATTSSRINTPWEDLPKKVRDVILFGSGEDEIKFSYDDGLRRYDIKKPFEGVIPNMERRYKETDSAWMREELERYQDASAVRGLQRLSPEARSAGVKIAGLHIGEVCRPFHPRRRCVVPRPRQEAERASRRRSPRAS